MITTQQKTMTHEDMVQQFQCPGCTHGMDISCGRFKLNSDYGHYCDGHSAGTFLLGAGRIALGLPIGFNKMPRPCRERDDMPPTLLIRQWLKGTAPEWDHLNVAVWAMEEDGFLFVRTFSPRISCSYVDVIEDGTMALVPQALNVAEFIDEID